MKKVCTLFAILFISVCNFSGYTQDTMNSNNAINQTDTITVTELTSLFNEYYETIDGAYAEKYASDLYAAYNQQIPKHFVNVLSSQEINRIEPIINLLVSEVINSGTDTAIEEFTSVFKNLLDDKNLSEIENYIVYDIYTNILYFQLTL